ncbi:PAS domain S-box protein [Methanoregula sp.]|jgi:PAS domain S-box-containing protein|uniref:PAS domain-containing protein n=1 Tax=Methanoregula sp. TaxID=2052170 RepID=UPI003C268BB0
MQEPVQETTSQVSEEKYRMLIEGINQVVFETDKYSRMTYISPAVEPMLGYTPGELIGKCISDYVAPDEREYICQRVRAVMGGNIRPTDYRLVHKDGRIVHVRSISSPVYHNGEVTGITGLIGDISTWKRVEEELSESEEKVRIIVEKSKDGIFLLDESGRIIEWNLSLELMTGIRRSDAVAVFLWDLSLNRLAPGPDSPEKIPVFPEDQYAQLSRTGLSPLLSSVQEFSIRRNDRSVRYIEASLFSVPTLQGFLTGGILRDVTERKQSEDAIREANKKMNLLNSVTRHDINNMLAVYSGYLALLAESSLSPSADTMVKKLLATTERIQRVVQFTREYQDIGIKSPVWQNLDEVFLESCSSIEMKNIRIIRDPLCRNIRVFSDPLLIKVFHNLIDNSLRHGKNVSEIRIRCEFRSKDLVILYEDDGAGVKMEDKERIFERGFGEHTGYGLFLIREILAMTKSSIKETGNYGTGARFEIHIPAGLYKKSRKTEL